MLLIIKRYTNNVFREQRKWRELDSLRDTTPETTRPCENYLSYERWKSTWTIEKRKGQGCYLNVMW